MGINMYGIEKASSNDAEIRELRERIAYLESLKHKKSKRKINFGGILPPLSKGNRVWDW